MTKETGMTIQETSLPDLNSEAPAGTVQRISEAASSTLSTATDATKDVVGEATEQTRAVASEAKAQAQQLLTSTKSEVQQQADARARQAADHLRSMSDSITALLDGRPDEAQQVTGYLEQAKTKVDDVVTRLETRGPQGVIDDLSGFARRRPGVFLLAAGAAGFAISRLAKAGAMSSPQPALSGAPMQGSSRLQADPMLEAGVQSADRDPWRAGGRR